MISKPTKQNPHHKTSSAPLWLNSESCAELGSTGCEFIFDGTRGYHAELLETVLLSCQKRISCFKQQCYLNKQISGCLI